jgi:hypothetical protein
LCVGKNVLEIGRELTDAMRRVARLAVANSISIHPAPNPSTMKTTSQLIKRPRLGAQHNLLTQDVTATTGSACRLTFLAGSKSSQGPDASK